MSDGNGIAEWEIIPFVPHSWHFVAYIIAWNENGISLPFSTNFMILISSLSIHCHLIENDTTSSSKDNEEQIKLLPFVMLV